MVILDYVILASIIAGLIWGIWKGFFQQIFALLGIVVVGWGTSALAPFPTKWLSGVITSDFWCGLVAMLLTGLVLSAIYGIIAKIISKQINKIKFLGWLNRLLGALLSIAVVYVIYAAVIATVLNVPFGFFAKLQTHFSNSWFVNHIYGGVESGKNFFGNWLVKTFMRQINALLG